jgi:hypothetical protein
MVGLCFLILFICSRSSSASDGGRISGTVVDPSGAVVRTAIVVTLNSDTGAQQSRTTDDYGVYTFPLLPTDIIRSRSLHPALQPTGRLAWT